MGTIDQLPVITQKKLLELGDPRKKSPITQPFYKGIHYGDFGTWKTVTSCRLPTRKFEPCPYEIGQTFILAQDPGWVSYRNHEELEGKVTAQNYTGFRHLEALADAFYLQIPPYDSFDTVALDTISGMQEDYADTVVRSLDVNKNTRPQFSVKSGESALANEVPVRQLPGTDDYHAVKNIMRPVINKFLAAPVNVIFIAHEREPGEMELKSKTALKYARPSLTEAVFKIVARGVHCIAHHEANDDKSRVAINFRPAPKQVAKSRIKSLEGKRISPDEFGSFIHQWQTQEID